MPILFLLTTLLVLHPSFVAGSSSYPSSSTLRERLSDIACVTIQSFPVAACSGEPDVEQSAPMPTAPTETCLPFDNPTFGKCSINHQYCDLLQGAFRQTIFIASGTCDKQQAMVVQDQVYENGKCYNGQGNSVLVHCVAGSCPSMTTTTTTTTTTSVLGSFLDTMTVENWLTEQVAAAEKATIMEE